MSGKTFGRLPKLQRAEKSSMSFSPTYYWEKFKKLDTQRISKYCSIFFQIPFGLAVAHYYYKDLSLVCLHKHRAEYQMKYVILN